MTVSSTSSLRPGTAPSYLDWMRSQAARLGNPYADLRVADGAITMMRGRIEAAHSDAATPQLSIQLCTAGDYELIADLGAGRFRGRRRAGDAIIGPPGTELILSGGSRNGIEITILAIDGALVKSVLEEVDGRTQLDFGTLHSRLVRDVALDGIMRAAWIELTQPGMFGRLYADGLVQVIIAILLRLSRGIQCEESNGLAPWQLNRVMELLITNIDQNLSVGDLAGSIGLSSSQFTRAFRAATGVPPHRRQMELRIEEAKRRLVCDEASMTEIAFSVGYGSPQALARVFQSLVGMSPSAYRRQTLGSRL